MQGTVSGSDIIFGALGGLLVAALAVAGVYVTVALLVLPVWVAGSLLGSGRLRAVAIGWWELPFTVPDLVDSGLSRLTRERDGSRWQRSGPQRPAAVVPGSDPAAQDWARDLGKLLLWVLALVGAFVVLVYGHDELLAPAAGSAAGAWLLIGLALAAAAAGGCAWVLAQRYRYDSRPPMFRVLVTVTVVCAAAGWLAWIELDDAHDLVHDYCAYGAVSRAQLDGCQSHVTANQVRALHTPASRFAQDGTSSAECGRRSGPFCGDVRHRRALEELQDQP